MDFHSMKRRELQALCKEHRMPANLSNLEMAKRLTELFKENEKNPTIQGLRKGDENASESEATDVVVNRKVKKVRFSPEHEVIEFTRSREIKRRSRRNSVVVRNTSSSVENVDSSQMKDENVEGHGRVTRSRGLKSMDGHVNEKKSGQKGVKVYEQKTNAMNLENTDNGELRDGGELCLRGKKSVEGVNNSRKRGKSKEDDRRDEKALDDFDDEKPIEEIVDGPCRVTRSRCQKLTAASVTKTKPQRVRRVVENVDNGPLVSAETNDNRVVTRRSSRKREVLGEENGSDVQEVLEKNKVADVNWMIEPQISLRRSKRNANAAGDSQIANDDTNKNENSGIKGSKKSAKLLAEDRISKDEADGRVLRIKEPIKLEVRRSNRRKDASHENGINGDLKAETEYANQLTSSVPQLVIGDGASKNEKKVSQHTGVMRRSRRKTIILEPVARDEKLHTDAIVKNAATEKCLSKENPVEKGISAVQKNTRRSRGNASDNKSLEIIDERGGDSIIQQKNEARKRKRGPISEGDAVTINNDPSSLKQSLAKSRKVQTAAIVKAEAQLSVSGVDSSSNPRLSSDTRNKIISDEESMSSRKAHGDKQDDYIAYSAESRIAELKTDSACSGKHFSASDIQEDEGNADSLEFDDVHGAVEQKLINIDKNQFEAQLFSQIKGSSGINTTDKEILPEGSNGSGNAGFAETSSSIDSVLRADLQVTEAEGDRRTRSGSNGVDHVGEIQGISVLKNLDGVETGQLNVISWSVARDRNDVDHIEASNSVSDNNKEDTTSKAGEEVGASQSCVVPLGKPRSIEGDDADEGEETYFQKDIVSELAGTEKGGCLKDHKTVSNEDDGFNVKYLFGGETSVRITPQDGGIIPGEYSALKPDEQGMDKEFLAVSPITSCPNSTNISVEKDLAAGHTGEREESFADKSILSEVAKVGECGSPNVHKSKCHEDKGFIMSNIFDVERRDKMMSQDVEIHFGENSVEGFDEKGMKIKLKSGHEADQIIEADEANGTEDNKSKSAKRSEGGRLMIHKSTQDEDWEFSVSNLFDGEEIDRRTPQDGGTFSAENSIDYFNKQAVSYEFPAVSTTCKEVKFSEGSPSLKEITLSKPNSSSKCHGTGSIISAAGGAIIPEKDAMVQNNIPGAEMSIKKINSDRDHGNFNQADEHMNEYTANQEQPKIPLAIPSAITNTIQGQEAWSGASESTPMSQTNSKVLTISVIEGSNTDENGNGANCGNDKGEFADVRITEADISLNYSISKLGDESFCDSEFHHTEDTEYQSTKRREKHAVSDVGEKPKNVESSQSWTEIELRNLFETTMHDVTVTGPNDTATLANVMLCIYKSDANSDYSLTNKKEEVIEGERESESSKTTHKNASSPTYCKEVFDSDPGSGVDKEDDQFKFLFATPIEIDHPSKVDETSSHEEKLVRADVSISEFVGITKDMAVDQIKSDELVRVIAENELQSSLCLRRSSDNCEEINYEELNGAESGDLVNTSSIFLSEASGEHLTENTRECLKRSAFIAEENGEEKIIPLGQSCLYEEATDKDCELIEKNTIRLSGSLRNLDKLKSGQDMLLDSDLSEKLSCGNGVCLESERKVGPSSEAEFELCDSNITKSNILENSHHRTSCYEDNLSKTFIETFKFPMDAEIGSFNDTSPIRFSKASNEDNEVKERKGETTDDNDLLEATMWDEKDDNSRSSHDTYDEPDCNIRVAILKSSPVCNTQLQSVTIIQNEENVVPAAGVNANDTSEKSDLGTPINNSEGGHENSKDEDENSTATAVRLSGNSNNDQNISDEVTDNENSDIEKLDVGSPLLEQDYEKNATKMEENSTATIVQFPISEIHLEEKVVDSNNDVPAFECKELLKESDVADTIKEYIDSELARINEMTTRENDAASDSIESLGAESKVLEEATCVDSHVGGYTAGKSLSIETKAEEQIEEMFEESLPGPTTVVNSSAFVDLVGNSGSGVNDAILSHKEERIESIDGGQRSSSGLLCSAMKKNARTILIHGTPRKILSTSDMKENAPTHKSSNIGDFTTVRPVKRKALQDVHWK